MNLDHSRIQSLLRAVLISVFVSSVSLRAAEDVSSSAASSLLNAAQRERLGAFDRDFGQALLTGKPEAAQAYFDPSLRLLPSYQKTVIGAENSLRYYHAFLERFEVQAYARHVLDVLDLGSQIAESGEFSLALVSRSSGAVQKLNGKYLEFWAKSNTGLSLITSAWNYDHEVQNGDEFRFSNVPAVQMAFQAHLPVNDSIRFELAGLNLLLGSAVSQHDAKLWSQFFADDAVLMANYVAIARGRAEIDRYVEEHVKGLPVFEHLDIRNDRVDVSGRYVVEYATHVANWRNGDSSGVSTGKNIRLWRREPTGALKMIRQIGSYD